MMESSLSLLDSSTEITEGSSESQLLRFPNDEVFPNIYYYDRTCCFVKKSHKFLLLAIYTLACRELHETMMEEKLSQGSQNHSTSTVSCCKYKS